jgi:predicted Zn-dependent protease
LDEARAEQRRARATDPLAPIASIPDAAIEAGRYDLAEAALRELLETHPDFVMAHKNLGEIYIVTEQWDKAIAEFQRAVEMAGASPVPRAQLARALALAGRKPEARRILDELRAETDTTGIYHPAVATALIALGEMDEAINWLESSYQQRHPALACRDGPRRLCGGGIIQPDRLIAKLPRDDPRVDAMLDSIGFPR